MEPITSTSAIDTAAANPQKDRADNQKSQFLQLLVAQLKAQNPLDPMDGSEFVAQLAQFSSLEELINIRGSIDNVQQLLKTQGETETEAETTPSVGPFGLTN
jgi:flagellar basal-body rod modification protein FlgD